MKEYYDTRAPEYDDWWHRSAESREGWSRELDEAVAAINADAPSRILDVACGTGYITERLRGEITGLDQSARMLEIAGDRVPGARLVQGDALELPFPDGSFDRLFASYFYCHLEAGEAAQFRAEARRVARELVVLGSRWNGVDPKDRWETRTLSDGSEWPVYKRVFEPAELAAELGGRVLHEGTWFVVVIAP